MATFLAMYLLHSTVLLAVVWLVMKVARPRSAVVAERLWKLAAVLPVLTSLTVACWQSRQSAVVSTSVEPALVESVVAENPIEEPNDLDVSLPDVPSAIEPDWRMGTLARPFLIEPLPVETSSVEPSPVELLNESLNDDATGKSAHPPLEVVAAPIAIVATEPPASADATSPPIEIVEPVADVAAPTTPISWQSTWQFLSLAMSGWMALGAAWLVIRSTWFRWRLRKARRVDRGRAVELLREIRSHARQSVGKRSEKPSVLTMSTHGLATVATKTIRLLIVPGFAEPAAFGLWRPTIVLPPSCESLPRDELRAVLAHELGHFAHGDVWWLLIGRVLTTCLGFQPLNRIARREWTAAAECLCDEWAVSRGVERLTLARCLTALAEHRLTGISLADALAAVGSPSSLRTRIERLVSEPVVDPWSKRTRSWLLGSSMFALAVVMTLMIPLPEFASPPAVADETDSPLIGEIESELSGLRTELQQAARLAEERGDPFWIEAAESLRERERRIVEHWQRTQKEQEEAKEQQH